MYNIMYNDMGILPATFVCIPQVGDTCRGQKRVIVPKPGITDSGELSRWCWDLNPGPL